MLALWFLPVLVLSMQGAVGAGAAAVLLIRGRFGAAAACAAAALAVDIAALLIGAALVFFVLSSAVPCDARPAEKATIVAEGISETMNGAVIGVLSAPLAALVLLLAPLGALLTRRRA